MSYLSSNTETKNKINDDVDINPGTKAVDYGVPLDDDTVQIKVFMYNVALNTSSDNEEVSISESVTSHRYPNSATVMSTVSKTYKYSISNTPVSLV